MAKISLADILTKFASALSLNSRFDDIEEHFNDLVLYRDNPEGEPNQMENELDMNSNRIINLPSATDQNEPLTLGQFLAGVVTAPSVSTVSEEQTATADEQAVFTLTSISYTQGAKNLSVYRNGTKLPISSYVETSPTVVTINAVDAKAVFTGDQFEFIVNERDVDADMAIASNVTYTPPGAGASDVQTQLFSVQSMLLSGTGSPVGAVSAPVGTLFLRTDGGVGTTLYVKEVGVDSSGWVAK